MNLADGGSSSVDMRQEGDHLWAFWQGESRVAEAVIDRADRRTTATVRVPWPRWNRATAAAMLGLIGGAVSRTGCDDVSLDATEPLLRHLGRAAGLADRNARLVHINAALAHVSGIEMLRARIPITPPKRPPTNVAAPFAAIDAVVAHELWHHIERSFEARNYRDTIAFRRRLGEYFGVAALEHAILGARQGVPEWQAAGRRLVAEVSPYATTSTVEATAEMFTLRWCAVSPPTGVVALFGELLDTFGVG